MSRQMADGVTLRMTFGFINKQVELKYYTFLEMHLIFAYNKVFRKYILCPGLNSKKVCVK